MKDSKYLTMTIEGQQFYDEVVGRLDYDLSQKLDSYGNLWDNYERAHLKIKISELRMENDRKIIYEILKRKFAQMGLDF